MIQELIKTGVERVLYEVYQRLQKNVLYMHVNEEIRRLISVIITFKKNLE